MWRMRQKRGEPDGRLIGSGSRSSASKAPMGPACRQAGGGRSSPATKACKSLVGRIVTIGASLLQADPGTVAVRNGCVQGAAGSVTFREVARAWYFEPQHLAPDIDPGGLEVTAGYRAARDSGTFSYAVHGAVVAVDPETGLIQILDYVVVGEGGAVGSPAAIISAVNDALQGKGVELRDLPLSPQRILGEIEAGRGAQR